jgi:hypothetical protein
MSNNTGVTMTSFASLARALELKLEYSELVKENKEQSKETLNAETARMIVKRSRWKEAREIAEEFLKIYNLETTR